MSTGLHRDLDITENHPSHSLTFADATERGNYAAAAGDVGRICQQTDTGGFYILESHSPLTWRGPIGGGGTGNVVGPASSTDNALVRFDGTTGKLLQNSGAALNDAGALTVPGSITSASGGVTATSGSIAGSILQATTQIEANGSVVIDNTQRGFLKNVQNEVAVHSTTGTLGDEQFAVLLAGTYTRTLPTAVAGRW